MDDSARGVATAALTLQSILLQTLIHKGVLTGAEALQAVDKCLHAVASHPDAEVTAEAAEIARICLKGVRDGLAEINAPA
jgi:hypothetical protein